MTTDFQASNKNNNYDGKSEKNEQIKAKPNVTARLRSVT